MFSHVVVGANDLEASRKFYDAVLGALGIEAGYVDDRPSVWWRTSRGLFGVLNPIDGQPACHANGGTIGFFAKSAEEVDAFHKAGIGNGGLSVENPPGVRDAPFGQLYLAYLRDPAGNKICALHKMA